MKLFLGLLAYGSLAWSQTCAPRLPLQPVDSVAGSLDQTDCQLSDGTAYVEYALVLPVRGKIQLDGASAAFGLGLILRDASFHALGSGSSITTNVERGTYSVLVNAGQPGQTGAFTLKSSFTPAAGLLCSGFASIGLNQNAGGRLSAASCLLPDHTPYDGYVLTSFGAGTLTITMESDDFDSYLMLRTSDGYLLVSTDAGGATNTAQISTEILDNQSYTIVASAGDGATGAYSLNVSFTPDDSETCRSLQVFTVTASAQDAINDGSCTYATANPDDHITFNYYDVQTAQAGIAEIRLSTTDFSPYLQLLDASGNLVQADAYSGGFGNPIVRIQLAPGNYTIQAFSVDLPGSYTLQYTFTPLGPAGAAICPGLQVDPGSSNPGLFSDTSCRTVEGPSQVYNLTMPAAGTLDVDLRSTDFVPLLTLRDAKDSRIVNDDNFGNITDSHITAALPAGTYSVVAATGGLPGNYTFTYQIAPHALAPCTQVQTLDPSSAYIGVFGAASCRGPNGQPVDYYQFTTPADGTMAAVMTSQVIDSFLSLQTGDGSSVLRWDDNSYGGSDAFVVQFLPAQTYRIAARASDAVSSGFYRLDLLYVSGGPPAGCAPAASVDPSGATLHGTLAFTSCMYPDGTFADIYQLNVTDTSALDVHLDSGAFDAYLLVLDAKGNVIDADDNSDGGTNALVSDTFDPGTYYVVAKAFSGYTATGAYVLTVNPTQ